MFANSSKYAAMMRIPGGIFTTIECDVITFKNFSIFAISSSWLRSRSAASGPNCGSISYDTFCARMHTAVSGAPSRSSRKLWPTRCRYAFRIFDAIEFSRNSVFAASASPLPCRLNSSSTKCRTSFSVVDRANVRFSVAPMNASTSSFASCWNM